VFWLDLEIRTTDLQSRGTDSSNEKDEDDENLIDESYIDDLVCDAGEQGESNDEDDEDEDVEDDLLMPEQVRLLMPSSLGYEKCSKAGLTSLMDQEVQLREGQANDALENLRMSLAHLSLLTKHRHGAENSQRTDSRAWAEIHTAKGAVKRHVKTYNRAHQALLNLNVDKEQFLCITKEDLRVPEDVTEENRIGQKSHTLAWFWRIGGVVEKENEQDWMVECEAYLFFFPLSSGPIFCY